VIVAILGNGAERELSLAKSWMSTGRGEKQLRFVSKEVTKQGGKEKVEP
jgi:hypothetical protein